MTGTPDLMRRFTSRRGRLVAFTMAAAFLVAMTGIAVAAPGGDGPRAWHLWDRLSVIAFGVAVAAFLAQYGFVSATPSPDGLVVRNLFGKRRLAWAEIVAVQFGRDRPWVQLELTDTDVVPVMAIQKADGAWAQSEARRLATLVARLGTAPEPPPPGERDA